MASVSITVDDGELSRALDRLTRQVNDLRPAFKNIGEHLLRSTRQRFDDEESPEGTPWAVLKPATIRAKTRQATGSPRRGGRSRARVRARPDDILRATNTLRDTITYQVGTDELLLGSPQDYAVYHQFGAPAANIPQRRFLGLSQADTQEMTAILASYLGGDL